MKLVYVMDPMCSWCWGFKPVFEQLLAILPTDIPVQYVMGGLAPDTEEPMPIETREYVQSQWRAVAQQTGAVFNWDFWELCQPRRSTYPACRAIIAAGFQDKEAIPKMIHAIQKAYYLEARNPSIDNTLTALANEVGLNSEQFKAELNSELTRQRLKSDFELRHELGVNIFPSVLAFNQAQYYWLSSGNTDLNSLLSNASEAGLISK